MIRPILLAPLALTALLGIAACDREGPAERAGSKIDKAGDKIEDTVNPPKGPAQSTGRSIDRALGN